MELKTTFPELDIDILEDASNTEGKKIIADTVKENSELRFKLSDVISRYADTQTKLYFERVLNKALKNAKIK